MPRSSPSQMRWASRRRRSRQTTSVQATPTLQSTPSQNSTPHHPQTQLEGDLHITILQLQNHIPTSLMERGFLRHNLNLSFQVNNHLLSINIQDPLYLSQFVQEALNVCMDSLLQNPWLLQSILSQPWIPFQQIAPLQN